MALRADLGEKKPAESRTAAIRLAIVMRRCPARDVGAMNRFVMCNYDV